MPMVELSCSITCNNVRSLVALPGRVHMLPTGVHQQRR